MQVLSANCALPDLITVKRSTPHTGSFYVINEPLAERLKHSP